MLTLPLAPVKLPLTKPMNRLFALFAIFAVFFALTVIPVQAADWLDIRFLGVDFITGKGLALFFEVPDDFDPRLMEGSVAVGPDVYSIDCRPKREKILLCLADVKKTSIGESAEISFGEKVVNVVIPEAGIRVWQCRGYVPEGYTYSVFDYDLSFVWYAAGSHTQNCPAVVGDASPFTSPDWGDTLPHYYSLDGFDRCAPDFGDGYYFDACWH